MGCREEFASVQLVVPVVALEPLTQQQDQLGVHLEAILECPLRSSVRSRCPAFAAQEVGSRTRGALSLFDSGLNLKRRRRREKIQPHTTHAHTQPAHMKSNTYGERNEQ